MLGVDPSAVQRTHVLVEVIGAGIDGDVKNYSVEYKNSENREAVAHILANPPYNFMRVFLFAITFSTTFYQLSASRRSTRTSVSTTTVWISSA
ncbi:hypothetical protein DVH05_026076 [Phytophthora capsici]|nr:hypothetical protein DVH05_026076 [Phytophthora capsici]